MLKFFNESNIEAIKPVIAPRGFRYGYVEGIFKDDVYKELIINFPDVNSFQFVNKENSGGGRKKFYVGSVYSSGKSYGCVCYFSHLNSIWKEVLLEAASSNFINLLRRVTGINFNSLENFGFTYSKEGCVQEPHLDGAVRANDLSPIKSTIACLLYFNSAPGGSTGTCIYEPDRKTKLFQVPNLMNSMSFFEQHIDAWHGFPMVPFGEDRRLISLAYHSGSKPINIKTSSMHKIFCPAIRFSRRVRRFIAYKMR